MALLTLGSVVTDIRKSIGGTTYSRNKGGAYARARVAPINRNTPAQSQVRANFASNAKLWSGTFTAAERTAWAAFAAANPLVNILGASIIVSGLAMAQKLNQVLAQIDQPVITTPPPDLSVPALAAPLSITTDSTTGAIIINTNDQSLVAGANFYVFATPALAAGKTPSTSDYRFVQNTAPTAVAASVDISDKWAALFGSFSAGASIGIACGTVNTETGAVTKAVIFNAIAT
jgi:hypothetical protein